MSTVITDFYQDLRKGGIPEDQAIAQTKAIERVSNSYVTKEDFKNGLDSLEKHLKYFFISSFVGLIYAPFLIGIVIWWINR